MVKSIIIYVLISSINSSILLYGMSKGVLKFILLGITMKLGIFPLNTYVIYIYRSISWRRVIIISTIPKIWYVMILVDMVEDMDNMDILTTIGIFSVLIGTLGNINNIEYKSILGYSSIINMGLCVILISTGIYEFSIIYILTYMCLLVLFYIGMDVMNKEWIVYVWYNLLGIPPLLGFKIKLISLIMLLPVNVLGVILLYLVISISSYMYLRLIERVLNGKSNVSGLSRIDNEFIVLLLDSMI